MSTPTKDDPLRAECANCASWRTFPAPPDSGHGSLVAGPLGACAKGLAPPAGDVLCQRYEASAAFQRLIVSRMMKDPMVLPVPLSGKKAREVRRARRRG